MTNIYFSPEPVSPRMLNNIEMEEVNVGTPKFAAAVIKCASAFGAIVISVTDVITP